MTRHTKTEREARGARRPAGGPEQARFEEHEHHGRSRMRHGEVRAALLIALQAGPAHGYELGQRLEAASGGAWRPSPGSIYPTLQQLADEEAVSVSAREGKRTYALAKKGLAELREREARGEALPWQSANDKKSGALHEAVVGIKMATKQVAAVGSNEQIEATLAILIDTRRRVYELLAQG